MASRLCPLPYGHTALQEKTTDEALVLVSGHRAQQPESLVRQALPTTTCSLANVRRLGQYERHHLTVRKSRGRSRRCGRFGDGLLTNRHPLEGSPIEASGVERTGPAALPGAIGDAVCSTAQPPGTKVGLGSPPTRTAPTASTRRTGWRTVTSGPRLPAVVGLPSRRRPEPGYENLEPSVRRRAHPRLVLRHQHRRPRRAAHHVGCRAGNTQPRPSARPRFMGRTGRRPPSARPPA